MAKVFLIGLEPAVINKVTRSLGVERHWIEQKTKDLDTRELFQVDVIFAGAAPSEYLPLLRRVRRERPALPFVVLSMSTNLSPWLDALEAGATDYCCWPIKSRQLHWLMKYVLDEQRTFELWNPTNGKWPFHQTAIRTTPLAEFRQRRKAKFDTAGMGTESAT